MNRYEITLCTVTMLLKFRLHHIIEGHLVQLVNFPQLACILLVHALSTNVLGVLSAAKTFPTVPLVWY